MLCRSMQGLPVLLMVGLVCDKPEHLGAIVVTRMRRQDTEGGAILTARQKRPLT
jgi:hypothetical protein